MLKKVKKWLGIEGVKINVEVPGKISLKSGDINGYMVFESRQDSKVDHINIRFVERFSRGRRRNKLIDEYVLGEVDLTESIEIKAHQPERISFSLPFKILQSDMDRWESHNFIFKGIVKTAKWVRGVKSVFRLEVEADVRGMAISPLVKKEVEVTR